MIMKILYKSVKETFYNMKLWIFLYIIQIVPALLVSIPVNSAFARFAGKSAVVDSIFNGNIFSVPLMEFNVYNKDILSYAGNLLPLLLILFYFLYLFLKGGIIYRFSERNKTFEFPELMKKSAEYFPNFIKIALVSVLFLLILFLLNIPVSILLKRLAGDSEPLIVLFLFCRILLNICFLIIIKAAFDYAQISTVILKKKKVFKSVKNGWRFFSQYPFKVLGLIFYFFLFFIVFSIIYYLINMLIPVRYAFGSIMSILFRQIWMFVKAGLLLTLISAEVNLFSEYEIPFLKWWYGTSNNQE